MEKFKTKVIFKITGNNKNKKYRKSVGREERDRTTTRSRSGAKGTYGLRRSKTRLALPSERAMLFASTTWIRVLMPMYDLM